MTCLAHDWLTMTNWNTNVSNKFTRPLAGHWTSRNTFVRWSWQWWRWELNIRDDVVHVSIADCDNDHHHGQIPQGIMTMWWWWRWWKQCHHHHLEKHRCRSTVQMKSLIINSKPSDSLPGAALFVQKAIFVAMVMVEMMMMVVMVEMMKNLVVRFPYSLQKHWWLADYDLEKEFSTIF